VNIYIYRKAYTQMFTVAMLMIHQYMAHWYKLSNGINKQLLHSTMWMNFKSITLKEAKCMRVYVCVCMCICVYWNDSIYMKFWNRQNYLNSGRKWKLMRQWLPRQAKGRKELVHRPWGNYLGWCKYSMS
jgi:hypothetical protein